MMCAPFMKALLKNIRRCAPCKINSDQDRPLSYLPMHRSADSLAKIAVLAWFAGVLLLAPAHAMSQELRQATVPKPEAQGSGQTVPATQQSDPAGRSISSTQAGRTRHNPYRAWRRMADREEAGEPDWLSPLATTSGRIKDELRYDIWRQTTPTGSTISTFGGGKGLEFIAAPRVQLLLGVPSYIGHSAPTPPDSWRLTRSQPP